MLQVREVNKCFKKDFVQISGIVEFVVQIIFLTKSSILLLGLILGPLDFWTESDGFTALSIFTRGSF